MNLRSPFFDPTGNASAPLARLLGLCGFAGRSFDEVHAFVQRDWYQEGKLRVDVLERHSALKTDALPVFQELGLVAEVRALRFSYLTALVMGATVGAMRKRIKYLVSEWERGIRFSGFVLLTSDRVLRSEGVESPQALADDAVLPFDNRAAAMADLPEHEGQAAEWLLRHSAKQLPWMCRPRVVTYFGGGKGNTEDTLRQYVQDCRPSGSHLLVSSQPYVFDQQAAAQMILPSYCPVDAVGYEAPASTNVTQFLDTIAKTIHKIARHVA